MVLGFSNLPSPTLSVARSFLFLLLSLLPVRTLFFFFFSWSSQGKWECPVNCCQWNHNFLWICCYLIKYNIMERHNMPFYISDIVHPCQWPQQFCFMVVDGCTKSRDLSLYLSWSLVLSFPWQLCQLHVTSCHWFSFPSFQVLFHFCKFCHDLKWTYLGLFYRVRIY